MVRDRDAGALEIQLALRNVNGAEIRLRPSSEPHRKLNRKDDGMRAPPWCLLPRQRRLSPSQVVRADRLLHGGISQLMSENRKSRKETGVTMAHIRELKFPVRTRNLLLNAGIETIEQLLACDLEALHKERKI